MPAKGRDMELNPGNDLLYPCQKRARVTMKGTIDDIAICRYWLLSQPMTASTVLAYRK